MNRSAAGFVPAHLVVEKPGAARTAFVVHGILGSAANWRSFVRRLVDASPVAAAWRWVLVDLRGHGESTALPGPNGPTGPNGPRGEPAPPHTVEACAADLERLAGALGVDVELVLGHSFGGKVALMFGDRHRATRAAWILDTPPGAVGQGMSTSIDEIARVFEVIASIPEPLPGRAEVATAMRSAGLSEGLAQWMTTNVRNGPDGYRWKFDLPVAIALVEDYAALDLWPLVEAPRAGLEVVVVRGGRSSRFTDADVARLDRLGARVIPEAGHWLHVDAPEALAALFEVAAGDRT